MKIKYILGAMGMAFGMTGCNLDITMYDGVMEEQFDNKNLLELSQGSYRLLKNDGGLIDNGYYFWAKMLILMMHIVWDMIASDAGAALIIMNERNFYHLYICLNNTKNGEIF